MASNLTLIGVIIVIVLQFILMQSRPAKTVAAPASAAPVTVSLSPEVKAYIDAKASAAVNCVTDAQVNQLMAELSKRERLINDLQALRGQIPAAASSAGYSSPAQNVQRLIDDAREREVTMFRGRIAQECATLASSPGAAEDHVAPAPSTPAESTEKKKTLGRPIFRNSVEDEE